MATSGTYTFSLDIHEIIEEAYENAGIEIKGGYDLRSAVRSLDLLLTEWVNDGINLWSVDQLSTSLTSGTNTYTLDAKVVDLIDSVTRDSNSVDTTANRISMSEYLHYPNKAVTGKPTQYTVERNSAGAGHTVYVYPTPDASYSLISWAIIYPQDSGKYTDNADIPRRFLPSLIHGLSYRLALKNPAQVMQGENGQFVSVNGVSSERRAELKALYTESFEKAKDEDRERTSIYLYPGV